MNREKQYQLESLEPRLLLSADPVVGLDGKGPGGETDSAVILVENQERLEADTETVLSASEGIFEVASQPLEAAPETGPEAAPEEESTAFTVLESTVDSGAVEDDLSLSVTQSSGGNDPVEFLVTTLDAGQAPPSEGIAFIESNDSQGADNEVYTQLANPPVPRPILIVPGIAGSFAAPGSEEIWYTERGIGPQFLEIDPLAGFYDDLIATLQNAAGYQLGKTLFAAAYDWRLAPGPAPTDNIYDGFVSGITADSITNGSYKYGVDYLGYWLDRAATEWEKLTGTRPTHVDVVTHSTGGLVARTYIQSGAYGGVYKGEKVLPAIQNLVMAGVPNRGAPKPWSTLNDDSSMDVAFRVVLSKAIARAYDYYLQGVPINGKDGVIHKQDNESPMSHNEFIVEYVPTVQALLATYEFLYPVDSNIAQDMNSESLANHWVLDLNDGLDKNYTFNDFRDQTGNAVGRDPNSFMKFVDGHTWIYYSDGTYDVPQGVEVDPDDIIKTITSYKTRVGPNGGDFRIVNFDEFYGHIPEANETWYEYAEVAEAGDGTVPTESSALQFIHDQDYVVQPGVSYFSVIKINQPKISNNAANLSTINHTGIMGNFQFQNDLLGRLGFTNIDPAKISTDKALGHLETLERVLGLRILDPDELLKQVDWTQVQDFPLNQKIREGLLVAIDLFDSIEVIADSVNKNPLQWEIPFTNQTFGQLLDITTLFGESLLSPIVNFMQNPGGGTEDLINWITNDLPALVSTAEVSLTINPDFARGGIVSLDDADLQTILELDTSPTGKINEAVFHIPFTFSRTSNVPVNLGALAKIKGFVADLNASISYTAALSGNLVFGYDMRASTPSNERFFIRLNQLEASASANVDQLSAGLTVGSLGASIVNASVNADAKIKFGLKDSIKSSRNSNITLQSITQNIGNWDNILRLASAFRPSASINAVLPVEAQYNGKTVDNASISITGNNLFRRTPKVTTSGFDFLPGLQQLDYGTFAEPQNTGYGNLNDFATVGLGAYEEVFSALTAIFQRAQDSPELQSAIPFAENLALGSLLDLSTVLDEALIKHLKTEEGELAFANLQQLVTLINTLMNQSYSGFDPGDRPSGLDTEAFYDAINKTLGFRFSFGYGVGTGEQNFSFDYNLDPLEIFVNGGKFELNGLGTVGFDLVFDLADPVVEVVGDLPLPADGILADPVLLELYLNGGLLPTGLPIVIEIAPDPTNTSPADLVDDINAAFAESGIDDLLNARLLGGDLLVIETLYGGPSPSILLSNGQGIGFSDTTYGSSTISKRVSITNLTATLSAAMTAAHFTAGARLGYLGIFINDGSANLGLDVTAEFTRTGARNIHEFFMAIGADPTTLLPNVTISGSGSVKLAGITVEGGFAQDPLATASIEILLGAGISFPVAASDPAQFEVIFNGEFNELLDFESLTFQDVIQMLRSGLATIESIVQDNFLNTPIPFIGGSINDVLDTVEDLAQFIDELEQRAPATIQQFAALLTTSIQDLLDENLPGKNLIAEVLIQYGNDNILRVDFSFLAALAYSKRFELDALGGLGLGNVIDLQAETLLQISLAAWIKFAMGIDLSNPASPVAYLYNGTEAVFEILLAAEGINFAAAAPLGFYIKGGSVNIDNGMAEKGPAKGRFAFTPNGTDRQDISTVSLSDFSATIVGEARARLPVFFPTELDPLEPAISFRVDFNDLGNPTIEGPDFGELFTGLDLFDSLGDGLELLFIALKEVADGDIFGFKIPFIGDQLADAATFLLKLREKIGPALDNVTDASEAAIQQLLYNAIGSPGEDLLLPKDGNGLPTGSESATKDDIRVDITSSNELVDTIEIEMRLGQLINLVNSGIDFDIGLPGLNLDLDIDMLIQMAWEWRLVFGIDRTDGFYIQTLEGEELQIQLDVSFPDTQLTGSFGFIGMSAVEHPGNATTGLNLTAGVEFNKNANDRITLANLTSGLSGFEVRLDGSAVMDLILSIGFADLSGEPVDALPSFLVDFYFEWDFANSSPAEQGAAPVVQFNNIRLDVGTFFSDFLRPIIETINGYLDPLRPVIDLLQKDIGVISWGPFETYFDENGDGNVTLLELAKKFGGKVSDTADKFISAAAFIIDLVDDLSGPGLPGRGDNVTISLGDFNFGSIDLRNAEFGSFNPEEGGVFTNPAETVDNQFSNLGGKAASIYSSTKDEEIFGAGAFNFELLDAKNFVKLLSGQPINFFSYTFPEISVQFGFAVSVPVPVLPINVNFGAFAGFDASLTFGYDSTGIMAFLAEDGEPSDLFGGFHIRVGQTEPPQLKLYGRVFGGASLVVRVFGVKVTEIGVEVGIGLEASFSLIDPGQGKLYFWQIANLVEREGLLPAIKCLFIIEGEVYAYGKFFAKVLGAEIWSDEFVRATLVELGPADDEPPCFVFLIPDRLEMHESGLPNNDTLAFAADLGAAPGIHLRGASISSEGDVDYYQFELLRDDSLEIVLDGHKDFEISLFDVDGLIVAVAPAGIDRKTIQTTTLPKGIYFLKIKSADDSIYEAYELDINPGSTSDTRIFYINDAIPDTKKHDFYALEPGSDDYDQAGSDPSRPAASLSKILELYTLTESDMVLFDTGNFVGGFSIGGGTAGFLVAGAPNERWRDLPEPTVFGSILSSATSDPVVSVADVNNIILAKFRFADSSTGLSVTNSTGFIGIDMEFENLGSAISLTGSDASSFDRIHIAGPSQAVGIGIAASNMDGFDVFRSEFATVNQGIVLYNVSNASLDRILSSEVNNLVIADGGSGLNLSTIEIEGAKVTQNQEGQNIYIGDGETAIQVLNMSNVTLDNINIAHYHTGVELSGVSTVGITDLVTDRTRTGLKGVSLVDTTIDGSNLRGSIHPIQVTTLQETGPGLNFIINNTTIGDYFTDDVGGTSQGNLSMIAGISGVNGSGNLHFGELTIVSSDNVVWQSSSIQNGSVYVENSTNVTISGNTFEAGASGNTFLSYVNVSTGTIQTNTLNGTGEGIYIESSQTISVFDNDISDTGTAMRISGAETSFATGIDIYQNTFTNGENGIFVDNTFVDGIEIHDNQLSDFTIGVYAIGYAALTSNTVENSFIGFQIEDDQPGMWLNVSRNNGVGVTGGGFLGNDNRSADKHNVIYNNDLGIVAEGGQVVAFNRVFSNRVGISIKGDALVRHNLIYENDQRDVQVIGANGSSIWNNTIYSTGDIAVLLKSDSSNTDIRNNIVWSVGGTALDVEFPSGDNLTSDYNTWYVSNDGILFKWIKTFDDILDWQIELGLDLHSLGTTRLDPTLDQPNFVNQAAANYRIVDVVSRSINSGDPSFTFDNEPGPDGGPNGLRINQGAYGDTALAALSPSEYIRVLSPDYYLDYTRELARRIVWESFNVSGNVTLELIEDGVGKVADIGIVDIFNIPEQVFEQPVSHGSYFWSPQMSGIDGDNTKRYHIKLTSATDASLAGQNREPFSIPVTTTEFYVNDGSQFFDVFTTSIGDNRNTGKTPSTPKAILPAVLINYSLAANDTVHVDSGTYLHLKDILISSADEFGNNEAFVLQGPSGGDPLVLFNRADPRVGSVGIILDDASFVTIRNIIFEGGHKGIEARNNSTFLTLTNVDLRNHTGHQIHIHGGSDRANMVNIRVTDGGAGGIVVDAVLEGIHNSVISQNAGWGIYLTDSGNGEVESNTISNNGGGGIYVDNRVNGTITTIGFDVLSQDRGNIIHDNSGIQIDSRRGAFIAGNAIYHTEGESHYGSGTGISLYSETARFNVVTGHALGIQSRSSSTIEYNRVSDNTSYGVYLGSSNSETLIGNAIYSSQIGVQVISGFYGISGSGDIIRNNLIYDTTTKSLAVERVANMVITNNTIYAESGKAVELRNSHAATIRNNIFHVESGSILDLDTQSQLSISSDFNIFDIAGTGSAGIWAGGLRQSLADWRNASFIDKNSLSIDPLFVDPDGADDQLGYGSTASDGRDDNFHLKSIAGSIRNGSLAPVMGGSSLPEWLVYSFVNDAEQSPGIDRGDDTSAYDQEPVPNGGFVNMGTFGNTHLASRSPVEYVLVMSPNGGETWPIQQTFEIRWRSHDFTGTVDILLIEEGVVDPTTTIASATENDGSFDWLLTEALTPGVDYRIKVVRNDLPEVSGSSLGTFAISEPISYYYVNDDIVDPDGYTTAPGDNANSGTSPSAPKASIRAILEAYDLGPDDVILVDAGTYLLTVNIPVEAEDSGVTIRGFADPTRPELVTLLDRGNRASPSYIFELLGASDVSLENLRMENAYYAIYADDGMGANLTVRDSVLYYNGYAGIYLNRDNPGLLVEGSTFEGAGTSSTGGGGQTRGIYYESATATIRGNIFTNNNSYGIYITGPTNYETSYLIESNTFTGGSYGAYLVNNIDEAMVRYNTASGATTSGLYISGENSIVTENIAFGNNRGIAIVNGAIAINNVLVHDNTIGIDVGSYSQAINNEVYNNGDGIQSDARTNAPNRIEGNLVHNNTVGIRFDALSDIVGNTIYNNTGGLYADGRMGSNSQWRGNVFNNVVYGNTDYALQIYQSSGSPTVYNNTFIQTGASATAVIVDAAPNVQFFNNIFAVDAGLVMSINAAAQSGFFAEYNLYHLTGDAAAFMWGDVPFNSHPDWFYNTGQDAHSLFADPLFVDPASNDYHLQSSSPAIDAGDPYRSYASEPEPSGNRTNIGAYGNTSEAALSDEKVIHVIDPMQFDKLLQGEASVVRFLTGGFLASHLIGQFNPGNGSFGTWDALGGSQGSSYTSTRIFDTTGLTNPAPNEVYQTGWRSGSGAGAQFELNMEMLPGEYFLRLHFADYYNSDSYAFDLYVGDVKVLENYNVKAAAGGSYKVAIEEFNVTVGESGTLTIRAEVLTFGYALINAIEVKRPYAAGEANPTFTLEASFNEGGSFSTVATGITVDDLGFGEFAWPPQFATTGRTAMVRVVSESDPSISDTSDLFLIANNGNKYYVNDDSLAGDVHTTAIGSNLNTGKDPDSPMPSLESLLTVYSPKPGDTIYIDSGTYSLTRNIVLTSEESGITIAGVVDPTSGLPLSILDRGNRYNPAYAIELNGASDVTLDSLTFANAYRGVYAVDGGAPNLTVQNSYFHLNEDAGLHLDQNNPGLLVENSTFEGSGTYTSYTGRQDDGIYYNAESGIFRNNTFINNYTYGIYIYSPSSTLTMSYLIEGNTIQGSRYGILTNSWVNDATIRNNTVSGSEQAGITISGSRSIAEQNTAFDNLYGIRTISRATAINNVNVYNNTVGIDAGSETTVINNTVFNNTEGIRSNFGTSGPNTRIEGNTVHGNVTGIRFNNRTDVIGNTVYNNEGGLHADGGMGSNSQWRASAYNNIVYGNTNYGIFVERAIGSPQVFNNTIVQSSATGTAVMLENAPGVTFINNIVAASDGIGMSVSANSWHNFHSDYNLFQITGAATAFNWGAFVYNTHADWFYATGTDEHSLFSDPQFVNAAGANFHLNADSPAIDAGDPASNYDKEPMPSGGRVNIGAYGNTSGATAGSVQAISILDPFSWAKWLQNSASTILFHAPGFLDQEVFAQYNFSNIDVPGWINLDSVSGGSLINNSSSVDLNKATDPAPADVYSKLWRSVRGAGESINFNLSLLPGDYVLRLHFVENTTSTAYLFSILVDGVTVRSDYSIFDAAGGRNIAVVEEIPVTVDPDGNISLSLVVTNEYATIAGIEAIRVNSQGTSDPRFKVEASIDGGDNFITVASGVSLDRFGHGQVDWTPSDSTNSRTAVVRVTSEKNSSITGVSDLFMIGNDGNRYYVNDGSTDSDVYTTAVGNNLNSGKTPDDPMASLEALLSVYSLKPGDEIYIDTGLYLLTQDIHLTSEHNGITITGATDPENELAVTLFDRGDRTGTSYAIEIDGASDLSIGNLSITGGYHGIYIVRESGSSNILLQNLTIYENKETGLYVDRSNGLITVEDSTISGAGTYNQANSQMTGIYMSSTELTVRNSVFSDNYSYGINFPSVSGASDKSYLIENSVITGSNYGVSTTYGYLTVTGSEIFGNSTRGLSIGGAASVVENSTVYDNGTATSGTGIYITNGAVARGNVVYSNNVGIFGGSNTTIADNVVFNNTNGIFTENGLAEGNRVYGNANYGIGANWAATVKDNHVYNNEIGIEGFIYSWNTYFGGTIENNLVYNSGSTGIQIDYGRAGMLVKNNTIAQPAGDALRIRNVTGGIIQNNIMRVDAGFAINTDAGSYNENVFIDYNLIFLSPDPNARVGEVNEVFANTLEDWQGLTGKDTNSLIADPRFFDVDGADDVWGYRDIDGILVDGGPDDNFHLLKLSPAIDRGFTWMSSDTDFDGDSRNDDPGTDNHGGPSYNISQLGNSLYDGTRGVAQGWKGYYYSRYSLVLPFAFELYGKTYSEIQVEADGRIYFVESSGYYTDWPYLAVMYGDLDTRKGDIFVDTSVADELYIRWEANNDYLDGILRFAILLKADGSIRFDYGDGNEFAVGDPDSVNQWRPTVGIFSRNGYDETIVEGYDGADFLTNAPSVEIAIVPGIVDIGAYEFKGNSLDNLAPVTLSISFNGLPPIVLDPFFDISAFNYLSEPESSPGGYTNLESLGDFVGFLETISIELSESIDTIDAISPATFQLIRDANGDGQFNALDEFYSVIPVHDVASNSIELVIQEDIVPDGAYEFRIRSSNFRDVSGNQLDGSGSGSAGNDFIRTFVVDRPVAPELTSAASATAAKGDPFNFQLTASGNPIAFILDGLPAGLVLDPDTGLITGTPTEAGEFDLALSIQNAEWTTEASFSLTVLAAPQITQASVNRDASQRSLLTRIEIVFDSDISRSLSGANITLVEQNSGTTVTSGDILVSWSFLSQSLTLTFPGLPGGSLPDGEYTLTIDGNTILANGLELDGDADGSKGGDYVINFHRLLGDSSGNMAVDVLDGYHFRRSYGSVLGDANYRSEFDFNNDGRIDATDKGLFGQNLRTELPGASAPQDVAVAPKVDWISAFGSTESNSYQSSLIIWNSAILTGGTYLTSYTDSTSRITLLTLEQSHGSYIYLTK